MTGHCKQKFSIEWISWNEIWVKIADLYRSKVINKNKKIWPMSKSQRIFDKNIKNYFNDFKARKIWMNENKWKMFSEKFASKNYFYSNEKAIYKNIEI